MRRFFIADPPVNDTVLIAGDEARHIEKVLRLGPGDGLELFDADGAVYRAEIESIGRGQVCAHICSRDQGSHETGARIVVCQAVVKSQKMDLIVEKCTELGATGFQPFFAQRSVPRWDRAKAAQRVRHWQGVARAAVKQSGARRPPPVEPLLGFNDVLARPYPDCARVILWEAERATGLRSLLANVRGCRIVLMVGPEGGFSDEEAALAQRSGFQPAGLGGRILRSETAAMTAVALAACEFGMLGG